MIGSRVGVGSSIYMAAVLEYLTAELIEIAGNEAKNEHKKRITPFSIKNALKSDEELKKLLENVTIGLNGE
jgi:histone H2A